MSALEGMIKLTKYSFYNEAATKEKLIHFIREAEVLSMGEEVKRFERDFAQKQGRSHAVFVNSGSSANLILLQTLLNLGRLEKGDRVGFSAVTWSTNVMPLIQLGLTPVPIDCELDTLNVSSAILRNHIKDLDALFLTNVLGLSSDIGEIEKLCEEEDLILLEDNCESLGSVTNGKLLGNFGTASTFSFFVGHHLSTIEGGMVCTDDGELHDMLLMVRAHGWNRNLTPEKRRELQAAHDTSSFYGPYTFYDLSVNVRPTEIQGFIGSTQLGFWDEIVRARERNFNRLQASMAQNPDFMPIRTGHMEIFSNFAVPVVCASDEAFTTYVRRFEDNGVEIRPIIAGNITRQPFYRKYARTDVSLPNADLIERRGFYFGNDPDLTEEELALLASLLQPSFAPLSVKPLDKVNEAHPTGFGA